MIESRWSCGPPEHRALTPAKKLGPAWMVCTALKDVGQDGLVVFSTDCDLFDLAMESIGIRAPILAMLGCLAELL